MCLWTRNSTQSAGGAGREQARENVHYQNTLRAVLGNVQPASLYQTLISCEVHTGLFISPLKRMKIRGSSEVSKDNTNQHLAILLKRNLHFYTIKYLLNRSIEFQKFKKQDFLHFSLLNVNLEPCTWWGARGKNSTCNFDHSLTQSHQILLHLKQHCTFFFFFLTLRLISAKLQQNGELINILLRQKDARYAQMQIRRVGCNEIDWQDKRG